MANNIAFQQMGKTVRVAITGAANTQSNIVTLTAISPCQQYYLSNPDQTNNVYVKISTASSFNVALPDTVPDFVIPVPPYSYKVITGPQVSATANVYAAVIGDGANAICYITPGEGL
jgi:hypothetical protein